MPRHLDPLVKLTLTSLFWGGAFVAGKVALRHLPPLTTAFWRFAAGATVLAVFWAYRAGSREIPRTIRAWTGLALLGLTGVFAYNWFFFKGLALAEAGAAALVITTNPALTALCSALLLGERLSASRVAGFALAAAGALVVLSGGHLGRLFYLQLGPGSGYLGAAVLCWVAYVLLSKVALRGISPLTATAAAFVIGTPLLGLGAHAEGGLRLALSTPAEAWVAILFMGVFSSALAFLWFYEGVVAIGASQASVFIYLVPGFALIFASFILGESVTAAKLAGGALVVAGVALTSRPRRGRRPLRTAATRDARSPLPP
jgi:drug/metabolite transporter (DMT)-like permease